MPSNPKFAFYEKVIVKTNDPMKLRITGKLAAILGRSQADDGTWGYAVHIYDYDGAPCCYCSEVELEATGEFDRRETFYTGESVRVSIDGKVLNI